jgi:predicted RNA binding protein YcfA (HicA-like mRNA interferase family)
MQLNEIIKAMEKEDWFLVRQESDIRQYKHPQDENIRITFSGDFDQELSPGALAITGIQIQ